MFGFVGACGVVLSINKSSLGNIAPYTKREGYTKPESCVAEEDIDAEEDVDLEELTGVQFVRAASN